ncbi:MAG: DUF932 domain-containing protein [Oscillospiraceae bacterium]|nr:DUF932 domain-containing protein [Oscillospiraceae bacterium]
MLADEYLKRLDEQADRLANEKMTDGEILQTLDKMFVVPNDASDRIKQTAETAKKEVYVSMLSPDLINFMNTKWGFINAVSDYVGHSAPIRQTKNYEENRWGNIIGGHALLDKAVSLVV